MERSTAEARAAIPVRAMAACAVAILCAALFLTVALPSVPAGPVIGTGQDEWYNVVRALQALYDRGNPSYFIHPALYYELLAVAYAFDRAALSADGAGAAQYLGRFLADQSHFLVVARGASVAFGAVSVAAGVWLGTELAGVGGGLIAGAVLALLPLLRETAAMIRVDSLALAAWLAAAALLVRYLRNPSRPRLRWMAVGIGIAVAANYSAGLLLLLAFACELLGNRATPQRERLRRCGAAAAIAFAVFLLINPYVVIDARQFLRWFVFQATVAISAHPHAEAATPWYYLDLLIKQGGPAACAALAGVAAIGDWIGASRHASESRRPSAAGMLAGFAVAYLAVFSAMSSQYSRFALPAFALLCGAGSAWAYEQVARRLWMPAAAILAFVAAAMVVWPLPTDSLSPRAADTAADYRDEMFHWILEHVPATATLIFESDTLPLLQTVYEPGDAGDPFHEALRAAFDARYPTLPQKIVKSQFIAAVYNYDPALLTQDSGVFFLGSSQNRDYIEAHRTALAEPAAFYDALDRRARPVHQTGGVHERLIVYAVDASDPAGAANTANGASS